MTCLVRANTLMNYFLAGRSSVSRWGRRGGGGKGRRKREREGRRGDEEGIQRVGGITE